MNISLPPFQNGTTVHNIYFEYLGLHKDFVQTLQFSNWNDYSCSQFESASLENNHIFIAHLQASFYSLWQNLTYDPFWTQHPVVIRNMTPHIFKYFSYSQSQ